MSQTWTSGHQKVYDAMKSENSVDFIVWRGISLDYATQLDAGLLIGLMGADRSQKAKQPVIDIRTKKLAGALRNQAAQLPDTIEQLTPFMCACCAFSKFPLFLISTPAGPRIISQTAVHLLAYHRDAISQEELNLIESLEDAPVIPTEAELNPF